MLEVLLVTVKVWSNHSTHDNGEPGSNLAAYPIDIPVEGYMLGALTLPIESLMLEAWAIATTHNDA